MTAETAPPKSSTSSPGEVLNAWRTGQLDI